MATKWWNFPADCHVGQLGTRWVQVISGQAGPVPPNVLGLEGLPSPVPPELSQPEMTIEIWLVQIWQIDMFIYPANISCKTNLLTISYVDMCSSSFSLSLPVEFATSKRMENARNPQNSIKFPDFWTPKKFLSSIDPAELATGLPLFGCGFTLLSAAPESLGDSSCLDSRKNVWQLWQPSFSEKPDEIRLAVLSSKLAVAISVVFVVVAGFIAAVLVALCHSVCCCCCYGLV